MSHVNHKLSGSIEGALAGGGDPATSPLYVFGPYLNLLVASGVASVVFGSAIWLAVLTVVTVSIMYRLVMRWVTDGSGGSGLNEEEFGSWAVLINAGITIIEYTLTFLVSIAALVTFLADRFPVFNTSVFGLPARTVAAIVATLLIGFAVNLGPKVAARTFGPATAAILVLLWAMIIATIARFGIRLPTLDWAAFAPANIHITLGGYARILALMTGIEIFANLVAAYEGPAKERSRKAFGSLLIIMGTTSLTMLVVGPAIFELADPSKHEVSVFTQTMDKLLPAPLPYIGTLIGVAVLLSAAAAAAQGIQNLSLGLRFRHYIPAWLGAKNRYGVAAAPVWLQVGLCLLCFVLFGTHEETYLALYAAGVFILLSLTGWAAVKRLVRENRIKLTLAGAAAIGGTGLAALMTTGATLVIFEERFMDGAWMYVVLVPIFYVVLGRFRKRLGAPLKVEERFGQVIAASNLSPTAGEALYPGVTYENILVPLDLTPSAELSLAQAQTMARNYTGKIRLMYVVPPDAANVGENQRAAEEYLGDVAEDLGMGGYNSEQVIRAGVPAEQIGIDAASGQVDLVVMSIHARAMVRRWVLPSVTTGVIHQTTAPVLVIRPTDEWGSTRTRFRHLLVALDGSAVSEEVLPHVHAIASGFGSAVTVLTVVEGSESDDFVDTITKYLSGVCDGLSLKGVTAHPCVAHASPTQAILDTAAEKQCDLIMMVTHGRGGVERLQKVKVGSVAEAVLQKTPCPVFLVSAGAGPLVRTKDSSEAA